MAGRLIKAWRNVGVWLKPKGKEWKSSVLVDEVTRMTQNEK